MKFESIVELVSDECKRLRKNKKMQAEVNEAFETAAESDEIPLEMQKEFDKKIFFYDGPGVTIPADEFVVSC